MVANDVVYCCLWFVGVVVVCCLWIVCKSSLAVARCHLLVVLLSADCYCLFKV